MSVFQKIVTEVGEVDEIGELVVLLRNSQLPTVVVEGPSDVRIYSRWIEKRLFGTYRVDVLDVGGRINLLSLYERRSEFAHLPVAFVANKGMWLFSEIPKVYSDIICTQGYSIENDVYAMSGVENLLDPTRSWEHWLVREAIIRWFAFEVEEYLAGMLPEVNIKLDTLVPKGNTEVDKAFLNSRKFRWPGTQITEEISDEYRFNLPGKLLFEMVARFSNIPLHGLYNVVLTAYESAPRKLIQEISDRLGKQSSVSPHKVLSRQKTGKAFPLMQQIRNSVRSSEREIKVNTAYSNADELVANLEACTPTVIIERENDNRFDWWIEQLEECLRPRMLNQLRKHLDNGVEPSVFEELIQKISQLCKHLDNGVEPSVFEELIQKISQLRKHLDNGVEPSVFEELIQKISQLGEHPKVLSIIRSDEFLSIYERRNEFSDVPIAFVGSREMWLFKKIPEDYEDIIWTQGYDLENDLYAEANLERLLEPHETWKHRQVRNSVIEWFAFEVEEFLAGRRENIDIDFDLSDIIPESELGLDKGFCQHRRFRKPPSKRVQQIKEEYEHRLPGKFLFQILIRFLNTRGRNFNFNVTERSLYDIALTMPNSQLPLSALIQKIEEKLDAEENRLAKTRPIVSQPRKTNSYKEHRVVPKPPIKQQRKSRSKQDQTSKPQHTQPSRTSQSLRKPKIKLGDKVSAIILKKDGIKVTVQLQTDNKEEIAFEQPYYPGKVGDKVKLKVIGTNDTGRVSRVVP